MAAPGTHNDIDYSPVRSTQSSGGTVVVTSLARRWIPLRLSLVTVNPSISFRRAPLPSPVMAAATVLGCYGRWHITLYHSLDRGGSSATPYLTAVGNYVCTITDTANRTTAAHFTVTQPTAVSATTSQTNVKLMARPRRCRGECNRRYDAL